MGRIFQGLRVVSQPENTRAVSLNGIPSATQGLAMQYSRISSMFIMAKIHSTIYNLFDNSVQHRILSLNIYFAVAEQIISSIRKMYVSI